MHHLSENKFNFLLFFSNRQLFQSQISPLSHFSCKNAKIFSVSEKKKNVDHSVLYCCSDKTSKLKCDHVLGEISSGIFFFTFIQL